MFVGQAAPRNRQNVAASEVRMPLQGNDLAFSDLIRAAWSAALLTKFKTLKMIMK